MIYELCLYKCKFPLCVKALRALSLIILSVCLIQRLQNSVRWKSRQKTTLAKKLVFGASENHGKNASCKRETKHTLSNNRVETFQLI